MWLDLSNGAPVRITPGHNIQGAKQPAFMHIGAKKPSKLKGGRMRHPGTGVGTVRARDNVAKCFQLELDGAAMRLGLWWLDSAARGAMDYIPIVNVDPVFE